MTRGEKKDRKNERQNGRFALSRRGAGVVCVTEISPCIPSASDKFIVFTSFEVTP